MPTDGPREPSSVDHGGDASKPLTNIVVRGAGIAGVASIAAQLVTLASYIVLARLISPSEFGVFAAGSLFIGVAGMVSESGMLAVVVQRRDRVDEAASTAFVATILGGIALGLLALALAPLIGMLFRSHEVTLVAASMAAVVPLRQTMIVPEAILQRRFSFVRRVVVEPVFVSVFGITAILGGAAGYGVWALVIATYAAVTVQVVLSWAFVHWRPRLSLVSFAMWRELARFGRHVVASEALIVAQTESLTLLIGRFLGTASLGQYAYALRIARQPMWLITVPTSYVLLPALSRISHDPVRFRNATLRTVRISGAFALPIGLITLPLGTATVVVLFGDTWLAAGRAVAAMFGLAVGGAGVSVASEVWKAAAQPHWLARTQALGTTLALVFTVALLHFGLTAVAFGLSGAALCTGVYALWGVARVLDVRGREVFSQLGVAVVASSVMALAVWGLEQLIDPIKAGTVWGLLGLATLAASGAVIYLALYSALAPASGREAVRVVRRAKLRRPGR